MIPTQLSILISLEFEAKVVASTPSVLRSLLARTPEVRDLRRAYDAGEITSKQIQDTVASLLRKHSSKEIFPHQTALAAIAVLCENRFTPFAREYLRDLARLTTTRFWIAGPVGRICVARQRQFAQTNARKFPIARNLIQIVWTDPASYRAFSENVSLSREQFEVSDAKS